MNRPALRVVLPALLLSVAGAFPALPSAAPAVAAQAPVARLTPGKGVFWPAEARPPVANGEREYLLQVPGGGHRLRVAFDHPDYRKGFSFWIVSPSGERTYGEGYWNTAEAIVARPAAGTWTVLLTTGGATDLTGWRFRALVEKAPRPVTGPPRQVLPNLRLVPPYEFTFAGSLGSMAGLRGEQSMSVASCTPDDTAEFRAVRCLRFSLGPANVGPGPFEMIFADGQGLVLPGTAVQRIHLSDGRTVDREAGQFEYHTTHAHYHHTGFGTLELYRVDDRATGRMTHVGNGPKQGFCTADVMIAEWHSFSNAPFSSTPSQCLAEGGATGHNNPTGTAMAISPGWADLYSWEQDGNYVDFGTNGDGFYVVRATADQAGHVLETDETDNTSYAYIQVTGSTVRVIERGRGQSPWDRRKVVANDGLLPNADV